MTPIAHMEHSFLDASGEKWVLANVLPPIDDPAIRHYQRIPIINLEDLPSLLNRHGLESSHATLYEEIYTDWYGWFDSRSKLPEGPSRASNREAMQVVDKALVIFERFYFLHTGEEYALTEDYIYTHFMQIIGLERNVEWEDLSQWELNILTTVQMSFAGILLSYLNSQVEIDLNQVIPAVMFKLQELYSGVSMAMTYAVDNLADNINEFSERY
jgi:hypothetical protein